MDKEPLQQSDEAMPEDNPQQAPQATAGAQPATSLASETSGTPLVPVAETSPPPTQSSGDKSYRKIIWLVVTLLALTGLGAAFFLVNRQASPTSQQSATATNKKIYKVGILNGLDAFFGPSVTGFKEKMTALGYVEGKNITYDVQKTPMLTGNQAVFIKFAQNKVDLIVALPTEPSLEAVEATKGSGIPIVSLNASTEGTNLIDSIQQPGHNLAGIRFPGPENSVKRLEVLHKLAPAATRVLVPYLKDYPNVPAQLAAMQTKAATLGQVLTPVPLAPEEISPYVAKLSATNPGFDAIVGAAEPLTVTPALNGPLFSFAHLHKLPVLGGILSSDDTGPIASIFPSSTEVGASGAVLADKIFKGAKAGTTLPILTPVSYLEVNLKVATRLGITPDAGLLSTATKIIR